MGSGKGDWVMPKPVARFSKDELEVKYDTTTTTDVFAKGKWPNAEPDRWYTMLVGISSDLRYGWQNAFGVSTVSGGASAQAVHFPPAAFGPTGEFYSIPGVSFQASSSDASTIEIDYEVRLMNVPQGTSIGWVAFV